MEELHRLKKGKLIYESESIEYDFGFVYDDEGELIIELYLKDDNRMLVEYFFNQNPIYNECIFEIKGITDNEDTIEGLNLIPIRFTDKPKNSVKLLCGNHITTNSIKGVSVFANGKLKEDSLIYFIEIEGLQMKHSEITEKVNKNMELSQNFKKGFTEYQNDHTLFFLGFPVGYDSIIKHGIIYNHVSNDNLVIEFEKHIDIELFNKYKDQLFLFLSLINGGEVKIRKVYRGNTYTVYPNKINSQKIEHYSFKKIVHKQINSFIPINETRFLKDGPFKRVMQYFPVFSKKDKKLDFRSVIYFLNNATKTISVEQKVFTLIIALEEFASKYEKINRSISKTLIQEERFEPIKTELKSILEKHRKKIPNSNNEFNNLMSRLCDINSIKKQNIETRIKELLGYAKININESIDKIIYKRHLSIHEAKIGETLKDKMNYYYQLDNLLREIIFNLIGYEGVRNRIKQL